ncbi:1569_t:CDS:2 [Dentiscutata heterogama]|uniref:1569_t:CDS:1 n=1 Tax=Dentiscutata heterogama TaxID=1316150 RepID=A0ACA9KT65_9GLOM|nr:1569_t:CDS:2 [Dentiscutata heterogama]
MDENNENSRNIIIEIDLENPSPILQPTSINNLLNYEDLTDGSFQNFTLDSCQLSSDKTHKIREDHKPQSVTCDSCVSYIQKINMYKQQLDSMEQEAINRREKLANSYNELRKVLNLKKELIEKYSVNDESSRTSNSEPFSRSANKIYSYGDSDAGPSNHSKNENPIEWYISSGQRQTNVKDEYKKTYHQDGGKNKLYAEKNLLEFDSDEKN